MIDDLSTGKVGQLREALALGLSDNDIRVIDVRSRECAAVIAEWRPDVVVHLAAQASLPVALRSPLVDADINIRGKVNVLEACSRAGVGLVVFAASAAIYGQVAPDHLPVTEQTPIAPSSPYGLSKATALHYLDLFERHRNLPYVALAIGNVYGPRQIGVNGGVIPRIAAAVVRGVAPQFSGDGRQSRDFVYVTDVAEAVMAACSGCGRGLVNIGSGQEASVTEVFETVCRLAGTRVKPRFVPAVPGDARRMVMDITHARATLGWRPRVSLLDGIAEVVRDAQTPHAEVAV
ncbi:NAD-dependent epimerase/dehydratase family protein [Nocardia brasiliensis]|uniref:NAD-dependent epimerase/dehydratase family protein n=1 Tax=Nocardia brasiliensis TaxID=37326 RepID=UPI001894CD3F|nr:NAD-dependent epimerase/dehydratase family protein [Nocardia brasiliensis]MBF6125575.1 GDP-mannose 4,6-dehydratase [Nocardia brasiliensis]